MSLFKDDSSIYDELEKNNEHSNFSRVLAIILFVAIGFAVGNFYSAVNKDEAMATQPATIVSSTIPSGTTLSIADVAELTANSVVEISTSVEGSNYFYGNYTTVGNGSGVIISKEGHIVTNNHVIDNASNITVTLKDGQNYKAELIGTDSRTDIAILKIDADNLVPAPIGDSSTLRVGELAVVIGNPLGQLGGTVTNGIISALEREIKLEGITMNLIQTNAAVNPGNSGGGLFNDKAELVGIVVAKSLGLDVEGLGFAIPINDIKDVISDIMSLGYVSNRAFLGITFENKNTTNYDPGYGLFFGLEELFQQHYGVKVHSVIEDSAAEKAGVKAGDHIISIDGGAVSSGAEVTEIINTHSVGDIIELGIIRENKTLVLKATLGEYKGE